MSKSRYDASPTTRTTGAEYIEQQDSLGNKLINLAVYLAGEDLTRGLLAIALKFVADGTYSPTLYTNWASSTSAAIKASPGIILSHYGTNANANVRYLQFHNLTTAPGGGTTPIYSFPVAPGGTHNLGPEFWTANGGKFTTGVAVTWSTAQATYVAATPGDHTLHVHYF